MRARSITLTLSLCILAVLSLFSVIVNAYFVEGGISAYADTNSANNIRYIDTHQRFDNTI